MQEPDPPKKLMHMQSAFAQSIRTPLIIEDDGYHYQQEHYHKHSLNDMVPRAPLSAGDRLSTYNQQYWFRLLTVLQDECPLLRHILGIKEFNRMCTAYLNSYPSNNPSLSYLAHRLPTFLQEDNVWSCKPTYQCSSLELIYIKIFDAIEHTDLSTTVNGPEDLAYIAHSPISFQESWFLFEEDWNLIESRSIAQDDPDDAIKITLSENKQHWAIFRNKNGFGQETLMPIQFDFLQMLASGTLLDQAIEKLLMLHQDQHAFLNENIQRWFHRWTELGWFKAFDER